MNGPAADQESRPFQAFAASVLQGSPLRDAITARYRAAESECVPALLAQATLPEPAAKQTQALARRLVVAMRGKAAPGPVQGLLREYELSSQEGIALMCLAEALLRIPDAATRDDLIRDKIGGGDWRAHLGRSPSVFVNAATWGLVVTGRLVSLVDEPGLSAALSRLLAHGGEPLIRRGLDLAMRMLGEQFVTGQTIEAALRNSQRLEAKGFRYSYDMLGEAAMTADDARRYYGQYEHAIHAIGRAAAGSGVLAGPGISVKLSALHPRYSRPQRARVMAELLPRLCALTRLARQYDIGLNIDAEEAERLELSLDLLEALCHDPALAGWNGIGFVVQAYQKRACAVLDWVIDLARRSRHRLMLRLVKGAYWDSEIKRAQQDGLADFPVFTRKVHTDLSYLACARKLLAAPDAVFPQFATHNAYTVAAVYAMAGETFHPGQYEFQCLHGMGEPLYEEVVGSGRLNRPCRIYAPVGTHATLLAYLVRRLLENGANSSFVNRIQDPGVTVAELIADPAQVAAASHPLGAPHPSIRRPRDLYGAERANAMGMDLSSERCLRALAATLPRDPGWRAGDGAGAVRHLHNPADRRDRVGHVVDATPQEVEAALARAAAAARAWAEMPPAGRAAVLATAADLLEARMPDLLGLIVREAGKSLANAVSELREAVDFLRYYGAQVRDGFDNATHLPLGLVACISPWNFPLAIFTGQVAAALAAGNAVLAKPAEETPLIAAQAVAILHAAGVPQAALQLVTGGGEVGARLVADARVHGVLFTGSTEVARLIQRQLAQRLNPDGTPVPLVAETGGQNALIVDSSALPEQVVADVLTSAFDSAGQRCSALRVLCLQDDIAERLLSMLKGALAELRTGNPDRLWTDVGPVISAEARAGILAHIEAMRDAGRPVHQAGMAAECAHGTFVAPTIIELEDLAALQREVFGPVLHVLRFQRDAMDAVIERVNRMGYALTFGVHTRIGETASRAAGRAAAGNVYVNRTIIGAVVGVQPFGGHGLSGTGPKAGGPLYLRRLLSQVPAACRPPHELGPVLAQWDAWQAARGPAGRGDSGPVPIPVEQLLPGPVGEENLYRTEPRGTVACLSASRAGLLRQLRAAWATGNRALLGPGGLAEIGRLPPGLAGWIAETAELGNAELDCVLFEGDRQSLLDLGRALAERPGKIVPVHVPRPDGSYNLEWLLRERAISTNTAAAGGNASLMMIG